MLLLYGHYEPSTKNDPDKDGLRINVQKNWEMIPIFMDWPVHLNSPALPPACFFSCSPSSGWQIWGVALMSSLPPTKYLIISPRPTHWFQIPKLGIQQLLKWGSVFIPTLPTRTPGGGQVAQATQFPVSWAPQYTSPPQSAQHRPHARGSPVHLTAH